MPGMTKGIREQQKKRKELLSKTKTKTKTKPKSKGEWAKELKKKNLEKRKRANIKSSVDRPQQKQKPKKKSILKKIHDKLFTRSTAPWSKGKAAKAAEIIRKDKPAKPVAPPKKTKSKSDRQPGITKANQRKESSRDYVKRHAGVTSKMPKAKDSQVMKAEADRRKRAKDKAAKKKERDNRADVRDAKRGGFISANAMRSSAKKANKAQADRKKRKSDELISRGRR